MARREFEMSEEDLKKILDACKPTPAMWGSGGAPMFSTPQENANQAWRDLGQRMGFVWDSARAVSGKGPQFFTAEEAV